jgi:hypothetical protein
MAGGSIKEEEEFASVKRFKFYIFLCPVGIRAR